MGLIEACKSQMVYHYFVGFEMSGQPPSVLMESFPHGFKGFQKALATAREINKKLSDGTQPKVLAMKLRSGDIYQRSTQPLTRKKIIAIHPYYPSIEFQRVEHAITDGIEADFRDLL